MPRPTMTAAFFSKGTERVAFTILRSLRPKIYRTAVKLSQGAGLKTCSLNLQKNLRIYGKFP